MKVSDVGDPKQKRMLTDAHDELCINHLLVAEVVDALLLEGFVSPEQPQGRV